MKFSKPTLVTLTAPTCAGKTYLLEKLLEKGFERIVSTTTRAPRSGEQDGVDYHFITEEQSKKLEEEGRFAELVTFRGTRYGVTHLEMYMKMNGMVPPIVILEPNGLNIYEQYCRENGWEIFKIFVTVPEKIRIERLNARTCSDIFESGFNASKILKIVDTHTDRLLSITEGERLWQAQNEWDAIVPGDNHEKAISFIEQGIKWRNSQNAQLTP